MFTTSHGGGGGGVLSSWLAADAAVDSGVVTRAATSTEAHGIHRFDILAVPKFWDKNAGVLRVSPGAELRSMLTH